MSPDRPILLFESDRPVLSSLEFALALDGLPVEDGAAPAILLATNPSGHTRSRAAALSAVLVEKPLLDDELARTLHLIVESTEAA